MPTIVQIKEREITDTPVLLFECELHDGTVERWSTHAVSLSGESFDARVLAHDVFDFRQSAEEMADGSARVSLRLANADSHFSQLERTRGLKGARLTARFAFFDLVSGSATSEERIVFRGTCTGAEELTESYCRVSFHNLLSFQRKVFPGRRIQRNCPWIFPSNFAERQEAAAGGTSGKYSLFFGCGYSADVPGGVGNLNAGLAFTSCDYTRAACQERGMFRADALDEPTRRFGGLEFLPASTLVRSHGDKDFHASAVTPNESKYNDAVPMVYGTGWYAPPVCFAHNDGNLTRMEVLLGSGEMEGVRKVLVNQVEVPVAEAGKDMTATGWFEVVSKGPRTGAFNPDFQDSAGNPLGDPYGGMAYLSLVVPNDMAAGNRLPKVDVLADGVKLPRFDLDGQYLGEFFSSNPAWITLDVLRRTGWRLDDVDIVSFAKAAQHCEELIEARTAAGDTVMLQRYRCNLILLKRRSAADVLRGIRNSAGLYLVFGADGKVNLRAEGKLSAQQPSKPAGSNGTAPLNAGWPAYEFGDGGNGSSGIARRADGSPSLSFSSKPSWDTVNRMSIEFQEEFNLYQQDSVSVVDVEDARLVGHEVSAVYPGLGVPNANQATRLLRRRLNQSVRGNLFAEFETSVRGVTLSPGDIVAISYAKDGLDRVPFRVLRVAPDVNYRTVSITAQIHDDAWYDDSLLPLSAPLRQGQAQSGVPRPLAGTVIDSSGEPQFGIAEELEDATDGGSIVRLRVDFTPPPTPSVAAFAAPILSISAQVATTGGSLAGQQSLYYAITGVNLAGEESALSAYARADLLASTNSNAVTLGGLSFPSGTTGFRVYRGPDPLRLTRVADVGAVAASFQDTGLASTQIPPPDSNYDHANFYWRYELLPPTQTVTADANSVSSPVLSLIPNEFTGKVVRIVSGTGRGQERRIVSNTTSSIVITPSWSVLPAAGSMFSIAESGWNFGTSVKTSPARVQVPNRRDLVVQISGRAANARNNESSSEAALVTRWRIGGGAGSGSGDVEAPPAPFFALAPASGGNIELVSVSFADLTHTSGIESGTVSLLLWDATTGPNTLALAAPLSDSATLVDLTAAGSSLAGDHIQIETEILRVDAVLNGGTRYEVTRGRHETTPVAHELPKLVFPLERRTFVVPFPRDFFGSPASGSYSHPFYVPGVRIAGAEMYVTNSRGHSPTARVNYTGTTDGGLRIYTGGQYTLQVEGYLAMQDGITPPLTVSQTRAVRDIRARVGEMPLGAPVTMRVMLDGTEYTTLTIPAGSETSLAVDGFNMRPLNAQSVLTLDIRFVGQAAITTPGKDLTVTVRV